MEIPIVALSTLAEDVLMTSFLYQYNVIAVTVTFYLVIGIGTWQTVYAMIRQISITGQTICSAETETNNLSEVILFFFFFFFFS